MINNYLFTFNDEDRAIQYGFKTDEHARHDYVLREFLQFLSSIYGYDLTEKYLDDSSSNS
jgi:hypothetical protein